MMDPDIENIMRLTRGLIMSERRGFVDGENLVRFADAGEVVCLGRM